VRFLEEAIYAIVRASGRQYRVEPDQLLDVDRLPAEVGSMVELADVLLLGDDGVVRVGTPTVEGARVLAEVVEHGRDKKLIVFKYKAKVRYRRKQGHRQGYTRLAIKRILTGREEAAEMAPVAEAEAKPKRPARRTAKPAAAAAEVEVAVTPKRPARRGAVKPAAEVKEAVTEAAAAPEAAVEAKARQPRRVAKAAAPADAQEEPVLEASTGKPAETKPVRRAQAKAAQTSEEPQAPRRRSKKTESD